MSSIGNWAYVKTETITDSDGVIHQTTAYYLTEHAGIKAQDLVGGKPAKSVQLINSKPFGETKMDYKIWV